MTCTLIIMRHGLIKANVNKRWHGSTDSPLLWRGRRQAKRLGTYAAKRYPNLTALYSSPLQRCQNTAAPLAARLKLDVEIENDLREWSIGDWEDMPFSELSKDHDFFNRSLQETHWAAPAGESLQAVSERCVRALTDIAKRHTAANIDTNVGVVSHGAAMQVAIATLLDSNPKRWQSYSIGNCSVTELILHPEPYIEGYNLMHYL